MIKKFALLMIAVMFLFSGSAQAVDPYSHVRTMDLMDLETVADTLDANDRLAVASTGTVYTQSFVLPRATSMGVEYRFASSSTIDVTVSIEVCNTSPTTEGSADTTNCAVANEIEANVADAVLHSKAPSPTVNKYARFKLKGNGSNHASTGLAALKLSYTND